MNKVLEEKIAITVYGTDNKGEMFVEDTNTSAIALDWITLVLRKRMEPGSEIIVFNKTNGNQAEFLLESQDPSGLFKAKLKDLTVDIWERDFGVMLEHVGDNRPKVHLVCKSCGSKESVPLDAPDHAKVLTGEVLWRECPQCAEETDWQAEAWVSDQRRREGIKRAQVPEARAHAPEPAESTAAVATGPAGSAAAPAPALTDAPAAPLPQTEAPRVNWAERRSSRRIEMKTKVRIRRTDGRVEVLTPINVSKGGIGFESTEDYPLDTRLRIAMHYREGEVPLESNGSIVRQTPLGNGRNGYGVKFDS